MTEYSARLEQSSDSPVMKTGRKVMIVDDDLHMSEVFAQKLESVGYSVIVAHDGLEAIEKMDEGEVPSIMLLDIVMPRMDGFEVIEAINENPVWKEIVVIVHTNLSQKIHIDHAKSMGVREYFIKSHSNLSEIITKLEQTSMKLDAHP